MKSVTKGILGELQGWESILQGEPVNIKGIATNNSIARKENEEEKKMLNSKMKRSMAWIMSAAVIMSAAPVSAADFTAEADVEVTAEAADAGAEEKKHCYGAEYERNSRPLPGTSL